MFNVRYCQSFKDKYLNSLSKETKERIRNFIETRLAPFPYEAGDPLKGKWSGFRKARIGNYRIIYEIQEDVVVVLLIKIGHRKDIYR